MQVRFQDVTWETGTTWDPLVLGAVADERRTTLAALAALRLDRGTRAPGVRTLQVRFQDVTWETGTSWDPLALGAAADERRTTFAALAALRLDRSTRSPGA